MPFDGFVMAAVAAELREKILGGRIIKIYQPEANLILLRLRQERENYQLLISAHPVTGRVQLTGETRDNPGQAPLFCMVLRKHLEGGRITGIQQSELDRVLNIQIEAFDDLGDKVDKILSIEIMGKHSNIILIDPLDNEILDGARRYNHLVSRHREVLPGRPYLPPPSQGKMDSLEVDEETFRSQIFSLPLNTKAGNAILKNFSGFSPLLANEVVARAQLDPETVLDHLGDYELVRLWQAFQSIAQAARENSFQPTVVGWTSGHGDFAAVPLEQFAGMEAKSFPAMSEALDFFYTRREHQELFQARQRELEKIIRQETDKLENRLAAQAEDLAGTTDMETHRLYGELITAQMYRVSRGMESVVLDNFYEPGETLEIPLDSRWTPAENAQHYFKKYNKAKSSKILIHQQMAKNQEELSYLESVLTALEQSKELADLGEIRSELVEAGYLKEKFSKGKKKEIPASKPYHFLSSDGYTILVGKNNKQNDLLTLKTAAKDDLWLHTKNFPGSHVIIRKQPGREIPFTTIQEAARLAAYYSKARSSSQVPVDYTLVKQVKKPHGAKPGMVIFFEQQTIYVTPAADLALVE